MNTEKKRCNHRIDSGFHIVYSPEQGVVIILPLHPIKIINEAPHWGKATKFQSDQNQTTIDKSINTA